MPASAMAVALFTNYLPPYRTPLYTRLAEDHGVEVLCFGGGERYVPSWFADLDAQIERAPFPARRLSSPAQAFSLSRRYETVIAPFAGGTYLPAAYAGAKRFVLWASVWCQPRTLAHRAAAPAVRHIYRHADAVVAYGEHVRRFVAQMRGRADDVYVAPQAVEAELFGREVRDEEIARFRSEHGLEGSLVLYVGRLVPEKGVGVLLETWRHHRPAATLVAIGEGPLALEASDTPGARVLTPMPRPELPIAYAASAVTVLPSIPTPRFLEPWGLVCNEAMHQGRPVIASDAVGAVAGGLVRHERNGLVVPAGDARALADAVARVLAEPGLGATARADVAAYSYDAMVAAFARALGH